MCLCMHKHIKVIHICSREPVLWQLTLRWDAVHFSNTKRWKIYSTVKGWEGCNVMNVFWIYSNLTGKKTWSTSSSCLSGWSGSYYSRCLHAEGELPFTVIKFLKLVTLFDLALICVSKCVVEENICMYIYTHTCTERERQGLLVKHGPDFPTSPYCLSTFLHSWKHIMLS